MTLAFRRGTDHFKEQERRGGVPNAHLLSDDDKETLCRSLLAEFGVTHVRTGGRGELIHGCVLPFGNHKDQDRNPTASLNYEKLVYHCFGCASGGSLIWFIGLMRDVSGREARGWLEQQTGLGEDRESLARLLEYFDTVYSKESKVEMPMPRMDTRVLDPWKYIHPYMTEDRGVPEATLIENMVGYGVIRVKVGEGYVNSHRIVIPHFWQGSLVGWQTRRLTNDGTPKYKNTPDFPKDRTIYKYDRTQKAAVIVESPLSVLSKAHCDLHIEATFGAAITDKQMRLISMHKRPILFFDNDEAGYTATQQVGDFLLKYSEVYVAHNPWNADPADMTDEEYLACLDQAIPYSLWQPPQELLELERDHGLQEVR